MDPAMAIGVLGTAASICGVLFAFQERQRRKALESKMKSQLWATLDRARYVVGDHVLLKEFDAALEHPDKHYLWNVHQAASDLYITLVEHYLSQEDEFSYDDLKRLCDNGFIYWEWQEKQWRLMMCRRPENRKVDPPPYFTTGKGDPFYLREESPRRSPTENSEQS